MLPTVNLCEESCIVVQGDNSIFNILLGLSFRKVSLVLNRLYFINQGLKKTRMLGRNGRRWVSQESLAIERTSGWKIMGKMSLQL